MDQGSDVKFMQISRFIFTAPSWKRSLFLIIILGLLIDGAGVRAWGILPFSALPFSGTLAFTIPAIVALVLTKPIIEFNGKTMTWNRSALLALACTVFAVIITFIPLLLSVNFIPLFYAISLGFIFGLRLLVLVAIADYRVPRMLVPGSPRAVWVYLPVYSSSRQRSASMHWYSMLSLVLDLSFSSGCSNVRSIVHSKFAGLHYSMHLLLI